MERKEFVRKVAFSSSVLLSAPFLFSACSDDDDDMLDGPVTIDLNDENFSSLQTVGGFAYAGDIIVIRSGENSYTALSKICTHESCTVSYNHSSNQLPCPCHGSVFSVSGDVINGPAQASLKVYPVLKEGNVLIIT